jgi:hypothetical protein
VRLSFITDFDRKYYDQGEVSRPYEYNFILFPLSESNNHMHLKNRVIFVLKYIYKSWHDLYKTINISGLLQWQMSLLIEFLWNHLKLEKIKRLKLFQTQL